MKRNILKTITFLLVLFLGISFICSCKQKGTAKAEIVEKSDVVVVIKINETEGFAHLIDAMKYLKEKGELTYDLSADGMVTSVNGKENAADWSACWMLYTSDSEMSNTQWGTYAYKDKTYGSAILGAESLEVSAGEYYVWSYDAF